MKRLPVFFVLTILLQPAYSQSSWVSGTNKIYANPVSSTLIGIGTSTPYDYTTSLCRLDIQFSGSDKLTYGNRFATRGYIEADGSSFKGNVYSRLSYGGSWVAGGKGYGVFGSVENLSILVNNSYDFVYAAGGLFRLDLDNPTGFVSGKEHILAGTYTYLSGSISSYPDVGVVAALYSKDEIKGDETWAGFFDGKVGVKGDIRAEEVNVELYDDWADYVFNDDHKLLPISELENFIILHNHLPGIPTESDVKENGIELGQMNIKLLEKIEEMTLYIIDLEKRIKLLENK